MNSSTGTGLTLGLLLLIAIATLTFAHNVTRDRIDAARQQWVLQSLLDVLPEGPFDSDPVDSVQMVVALELGSDEAQAIHTTYRNTMPLAAVLNVVAPDGYNGDIHLLLGVSFDGLVTGVRVIEHRETPGLGDRIDYSRSDWITQFNGLSLSSGKPTDWTVTANGGRFDAFTGATITPRAVITAVHRALRWFAANRQEIFAS